jgi:hypothetical protein
METQINIDILEIGNETNVGTIIEIFKEQNQIETENGIFHIKMVKLKEENYLINSILNNELSIKEFANEIRNKLKNSNNNQENLILYHGTTQFNYDKINYEKIFGQDNNSITFLTDNKNEAKEYARNKNKYINPNLTNEELKEKEKCIFEFKVPSWSIKQNESTEEYETEYQFHIKKITYETEHEDEYILEPTDESLINLELQSYSVEDKNKILNHFKKQQVRELFNDNGLIDLEKRIKEIENNNTIEELLDPKNKDMKELEKEIKDLKKDRYELQNSTILLYHGTSSEHNIIGNNGEGLKPTTKFTAKSLGVSLGAVYLTPKPDVAEQFGNFAYPSQDITIYAIRVKLGGNGKPNEKISPDKDNINYKKHYDYETYGNIKTNLSNSLIFGRSCCVKSKIPTYNIRDVSQIFLDKNKDNLIFYKPDNQNYDLYLKEQQKLDKCKTIKNSSKINR